MTSSFRSFAIIPACGESRRMGKDKLLLPWQGSTVLETVITVWQQTPVDRICIIIRSDRNDLRKLLEPLNVDVIIAETPPTDMKASVARGLEHIAGQYAPVATDAWLVSPADIPTLSAGTIEAVLAAYSRQPDQAMVPTHQGKQGHPILFPWRLASEVPELPDDRGINAFLKTDPWQAVPVEELGEDVDTPEEFDKLRRLYDAT